MPTRKRNDYLCKRAYELAASGAHISPITIVSALVNEGHPEAAELLNNDIIRADLRRVCSRRWRGGAAAEDLSRAVDGAPPVEPSDRAGDAEREKRGPAQPR